MTGFFNIARGLSLVKALKNARRTMIQFQTASFFVCLIMDQSQNVFPAYINKCSTIGPRLNAGKNVNAPTIRITLTSNTVNNGVVTGNVPNEGGTIFLRARFPATASMGMIIKKRPTSIAAPIVELYQYVFAEIPANADPLFPVPDV